VDGHTIERQMANKRISCNKRSLNLTDEAPGGSNAKRQCSENLFWPEGDDNDSFFSNANLEDLLDGRKEELFGTQAAETGSNKLQKSGSDEGLGLFVDTSFSDTQKASLERSYKPSETSAPTDGHKIDLADDDNADEVFKKINLNDLSIGEMEDIFCGADDFSEPIYDLLLYLCYYRQMQARTGGHLLIFLHLQAGVLKGNVWYLLLEIKFCGLTGNGESHSGQWRCIVIVGGEDDFMNRGLHFL